MLQGLRIVLPESRELDLFAGLVERHGARAIRCPLVAIRDLEEAGPAEAWLRRLGAGALDDLVLLTGEGVDRLLGLARRAGIEAEAVEGLRRTRKVARGPKPVRALRAVGLDADLVSGRPTSEGVIATLAGLDLRGRRVGVQLYPEAPDTLARAIERAGATADPVLPYRYASDEEDARVGQVIAAMAAGEVDVIAFTSTPQVRRLREVARTLGLVEALDEGVRRTRIAAIGPVTAAAVEAAGWRVDAMPQSRFHLKPFVRELAALSDRAEPPRGG